jgi:hypothetical protein
MTEAEAYEKLQEFLALADELNDSGHYSVQEILDELKNRIG